MTDNVIKSIFKKIKGIYISSKSKTEIYNIPLDEAIRSLQEFFDTKQDFWSEVDIKGEFKTTSTFSITLKNQRTHSSLEGTIGANLDESTLISFKTYPSFDIQLFSILIPLVGIITIVKSITSQTWGALPYAICITIIVSFVFYRISEASKYVLEDRYYRHIHKIMKNPSTPKKVKPEM